MSATSANKNKSQLACETSSPLVPTRTELCRFRFQTGNGVDKFEKMSYQPLCILGFGAFLTKVYVLEADGSIAAYSLSGNNHDPFG
ncbi:MAG: hypothetical protein KBT18_04555, partial [Comamonas sp.]|nr:hypothetical protein [Candidatus Comamonas equi]